MARRIALCGAVAVAGAGAAAMLLPERLAAFSFRKPQGVASAPLPAMPEIPATAESAVRAPLPSFDVTRLGARRNLVTAGRAAPGADVTLLDLARPEEPREIGRARADARGEWVILPAEPLPPGVAELGLVARGAGGTLRGADTVLLVVPAPAALDPPAPLAVLLPPTAAPGIGPRLLQDPALGRTRLGLDIVDYDDAGGMRFAGSAPPGSKVRLQVGRRPASEAVADAGGRWTLLPVEQPVAGRHQLRLEQVAADGSVAARLELPFLRERLGPGDLADDQVIVQPGYNLWRIARQVYGRGIRYTVIYAANRERIRDPRLIYPGQLFSLPGTPVPPASSVSR